MRDTQEAGPAVIEATAEINLAVQIWAMAVELERPNGSSYVTEEGWTTLSGDSEAGTQRAYWREHADPRFYDRARMRTIRTTTHTTVVREVLP